MPAKKTPTTIVTNPKASVHLPNQTPMEGIEPKPGRVRPGREFDGARIIVTGKSKPVRKEQPQGAASCPLTLLRTSIRSE